MLTISKILAYIELLKHMGYTEEEIKQMPIYLGNDEELNGVYEGGYIDLVDTDNPDENMTDVIQEYDRDFHGRCILLS